MRNTALQDRGVADYQTADFFQRIQVNVDAVFNYAPQIIDGLIRGKIEDVSRTLDVGQRLIGEFSISDQGSIMYIGGLYNGRTPHNLTNDTKIHNPNEYNPADDALNRLADKALALGANIIVLIYPNKSLDGKEENRNLTLMVYDRALNKGKIIAVDTGIGGEGAKAYQDILKVAQDRFSNLNLVNAGQTVGFLTDVDLPLDIAQQIVADVDPHLLRTTTKVDSSQTVSTNGQRNENLMRFPPQGINTMLILQSETLFHRGIGIYDLSKREDSNHGDNRFGNYSMIDIQKARGKSADEAEKKQDEGDDGRSFKSEETSFPNAVVKSTEIKAIEDVGVADNSGKKKKIENIDAKESMSNLPAMKIPEETVTVLISPKSYSSKGQSKKRLTGEITQTSIVRKQQNGDKQQTQLGAKNIQEKVVIDMQCQPENKKQEKRKGTLNAEIAKNLPSQQNTRDTAGYRDNCRESMIVSLSNIQHQVRDTVEDFKNAMLQVKQEKFEVACYHDLDHDNRRGGKMKDVSGQVEIKVATAEIPDWPGQRVVVEKSSTEESSSNNIDCVIAMDNERDYMTDVIYKTNSLKLGNGDRADIIIERKLCDMESNNHLLPPLLSFVTPTKIFTDQHFSEQIGNLQEIEARRIWEMFLKIYFAVGNGDGQDVWSNDNSHAQILVAIQEITKKQNPHQFWQMTISNTRLLGILLICIIFLLQEYFEDQQSTNN